MMFYNELPFLGVGTYSGCRDILQLARLYLGEILSAFEFIDGASMRCLDENKKLRSVLTSNPPFNVLVETMGMSNGDQNLYLFHWNKLKIEEKNKYAVLLFTYSLCRDYLS